MGANAGFALEHWDALNPVDGMAPGRSCRGRAWAMMCGSRARIWGGLFAEACAGGVRSFRDLAAPVAGSSFDYDQSVWSKNKSLSNATGTHCVHTDIYDVEQWGAQRDLRDGGYFLHQARCCWWLLTMIWPLRQRCRASGAV
jgi:hypothetical protein